MAGAISQPRREHGSIRRLLVTAMAVGFLALIAVVIGTAWVNGRIQDNTGWVVHTYQVERDLGDLAAVLERSEAGRRAYMLTRRPEARKIATDNGAELLPRLEMIGRLTADNPRQVARVNGVRALLMSQNKLRERSLALVDRGDETRAVAEFTSDFAGRTMRTLRAALTEMRLEERTLLGDRNAELRTSVRQFYALLGVVGVLLLLLATTTLATVLRYTRELTLSATELRVLNETLEDQVAERTADLSRANEEIQRFAYIVSHDLRSPLVNVMGFTAELEAGAKAIAELVDRAEAAAPDIVTPQARDAAREDLPEAIGFIRTSTAKMDRLINAILQLSREGRRVITAEPIDMAALVAGVRDTLQHRLDERDATIEIEGDLPALTSDRLAIEQVFANVIENAVKYLDARRPGRVVVRGHVAGARAIFEVEDNGRGIDPRDHARVFDLFRRSGQQDQPGEGIGLAHVRALIYRLGGTIDVASTLGEGATFRINLPIHFVDISGTAT